MYKKNQNHQYKFTDFNQPIGLEMDPENRWVKKAEMIPWNAIEEKYAKLFPSDTGNPAKPVRMALGALLIQKQYGYSDRELLEQIRENPYYQYFIGLPGYQKEKPFDPSLLVAFRKRLPDDLLDEVNEMIIEYNRSLLENSEPDPSSPSDDAGSSDPPESEGPSDPHDDAGPSDPPDGGDGSGNEAKETKPGTPEKTTPNKGTLILDATCAPQHIAFPQDINLLNEAREKLEGIIDTICFEYNLPKPRTYRINARKDYLSLAKCRKRISKRIRKAIKQQLQYIRRDLGYIHQYLDRGMEISTKHRALLDIIQKVYEQQEYMYTHKTHSVKDRIVSISQPYVRPIVRGKAKTPTEFGTKLDLSIDENGMGRIEKQSFDAYNEKEVLIGAVERYKARTGHYPERVLADKIYRTQENRAYCKKHGIRITGPALGRPKKNISLEDKRQAYDDAVDRIEVERDFSLAKRCFGLGMIVTKLEETTRSSISLSIISMNLNRLARFLFVLFLKLIFNVQLVDRNRSSTGYIRYTGQYG